MKETSLWWLLVPVLIVLVAVGVLLGPTVLQELKVPSDQPKEITTFERANGWIMDVVNMEPNSWETIALLIFILDEEGQPGGDKADAALQEIWDAYGPGRDLLRMDFAIYREGKWYVVVVGYCSSVNNCSFGPVVPAPVPAEAIKWLNG